MHRKTTENAVFTRNFEFIDPLRSFDRNMVFNYTNLTIRKGLYYNRSMKRIRAKIGRNLEREMPVILSVLKVLYDNDMLDAIDELVK